MMVERRWRLASKVGLVAFGIAFSIACGCRRTMATKVSASASVPNRDAEALNGVRETLRKQASVPTVQQSLQQLNAYIGKDAQRRPPGLSEAQRKLLADEVGLDADELAEAGGVSYTGLDAHYIEMCFLLRDAARSFTASDLAPLQRTQSAFDWVVRQVRLPANEFEKQWSRDAEPLPPQFVLRRGWGTATERAFLFLAMLQQLGIDGCMVTLPAESGDSRYWIPGALIDKEIYLFDTRMGIALPSPSGKGIATLREIRSASDPFASLQNDGAPSYDVTPEQVKRAEVHLAYPLSSLAPRMILLEGLLDMNKVRLAVDLAAVRVRFEEAAKPLAVPVSVDCRPASVNTVSPLRVMRQFLPAGEGGVDSAKSSRKQREEVALIPWSALPRDVLDSPFSNALLFKKLQRVFGELYVQFPLPASQADADTPVSKPDEMMRNQGKGMSPDETRDDVFQRFAALLSIPDKTSSPQSMRHFKLAAYGVRDNLIRSRLDDAASKLMEGLDQAHAQKALRQRDSELNTKMVRWLESAVEAEAQLQRALRQGAAGDLETVQSRLNALWFGDTGVPSTTSDSAPPKRARQAPLPVWLVWVLGSTADSLGADAAYYLALCKHEQAERASAAGNKVSAERVADAWRTADRLWTQFLEEYPNSAGALAARACKARALEVIGDRAAAAAQWQNLAGESSPLEKLGRLYQAKKMKDQ